MSLKNLAVCVLEMARLDAERIIENSSCPKLTAKYKRQAILFLQGRDRVEDLEFWCDIAELSSYNIIKTAREKYNADTA